MIELMYVPNIYTMSLSCTSVSHFYRYLLTDTVPDSDTIKERGQNSHKLMPTTDIDTDTDTIVE